LENIGKTLRKLAGDERAFKSEVEIFLNRIGILESMTDVSSSESRSIERLEELVQEQQREQEEQEQLGTLLEDSEARSKLRTYWRNEEKLQGRIKGKKMDLLEKEHKNSESESEEFISSLELEKEISQISQVGRIVSDMLNTAYYCLKYKAVLPEVEKGKAELRAVQEDLKAFKLFESEFANVEDLYQKAETTLSGLDFLHSKVADGRSKLKSLKSKLDFIQVRLETYCSKLEELAVLSSRIKSLTRHLAHQLQCFEELSSAIAACLDTSLGNSVSAVEAIVDKISDGPNSLTLLEKKQCYFIALKILSKVGRSFEDENDWRVLLVRAELYSKLELYESAAEDYHQVSEILLDAAGSSEDLSLIKRENELQKKAVREKEQYENKLEGKRKKLEFSNRRAFFFLSKTRKSIEKQSSDNIIALLFIDAYQKKDAKVTTCVEILNKRGLSSRQTQQMLLIRLWYFKHCDVTLANKDSKQMFDSLSDKLRLSIEQSEGEEEEEESEEILTKLAGDNESNPHLQFLLLELGDKRASRNQQNRKKEDFEGTSQPEEEEEGESESEGSSMSPSRFWLN